MNEAETRAELIDPAIKAAGWGVVAGSRVRREVIAPGRVGTPDRPGKATIADYVLTYRDQKLAVIEAKKQAEPVTLGLAQAKRDAGKLQVPIVFSTNGDGLYRADLRTGKESDVEPLAYPTPDELWADVFGPSGGSLVNRWREAFGRVPYEDKGGQWPPRYYQHNAVTKTLDAIAAGRDRVLLTMATGTGKTAVAFHIVWKLFHARWTLANRQTPDAEGGRPRVLFLADRNVLANQALSAFSAFPDDALVRIDPATIAKKGRVPTNGSVFFTIFQTFMTKGPGGKDDFRFGELPPDFFDLVIIDECHRGGASDESNWRGILEYFAPAVQLGLTATPKRTNNADTYDYFGEPVYTYSLKEGINDGYLTPFKVRQVHTTIDEYVYTSDDDVEEGEVEQGKRYTETDFNRIIEIKAREAYRVKMAMEAIGPREKVIVFCATEDHALAVRDLINQNKPAGITHPDYCARVTASEGSIGDGHLKQFQDNEKTIPTVLTTSKKLSTGVDARNVRHIVLLRPVRSMIEFKQIVGRGTRLFDGKDFFTIHDFVRAYEHFSDPEWDGEPAEPPEPAPPPAPRAPGDPEPGDPEPEPEPGPPRPKRIKIKLADGKERLIDSMVQTSFWSPEGRPMSAAEFIERLFGELPSLFKDEAELRKVWSDPKTRSALLDGLAERGYDAETLRQIAKVIHAERSDLYDVLAHVAYATPTVTRSDRVGGSKARIMQGRSEEQQRFLSFILDHYVTGGVGELGLDKLPDLLELHYGGVREAAAALGGATSVRETFVGFQPALYTS